MGISAFALSIGFLSLVQAALIAICACGLGGRLERLGSRWWALTPPASIGIVVALIAFDRGFAHALTLLALVTVPPLAAFALARLVRGARPSLAPLAVALFVMAWLFSRSLLGEGAALCLSALACVTLSSLLVAVVPERFVKLAIYAMAIVDTALVAADLLQAPNAVLSTVRPGAGLPRLQSVHFGSAAMGFGDLFIATTVGCVLCRDRRLQVRTAALAAVFAVSFDLLFFFIRELPATVPIALALAVVDFGRGRVRSPWRLWAVKALGLRRGDIGPSGAGQG